LQGGLGNFLCVILTHTLSFTPIAYQHPSFMACPKHTHEYGSFANYNGSQLTTWKKDDAKVFKLAPSSFTYVRSSCL